MDRRRFLETSFGAAATAALPVMSAAPVRLVNRTKTLFNAYYLRAHMYTCVPRQVREDLEWMAGVGTDYVSVAVLEQDLFAAVENLTLVCTEAARVGIKVLAVPARWGGLTAGAPKVPSLFSALHPETWVMDRAGRTDLAPLVSGVISSVHHPKTLAFFCDTLADVYRKLPSLAGMILDEPKGFQPDYSPAAVQALGRNAPKKAHYAAATAFYSAVCAFAKAQFHDKLTLLFGQASSSDEIHAAQAAVGPLDFFGFDGRPWDRASDRVFQGGDPTSESGKGKVLLDRGVEWIKLARSVPGRRAFFLAENHNITAPMIDVIDRGFPRLLALGADMVSYYYYPRNVQEPERAMGVIGRHIQTFAGGARTRPMILNR